jgi:hypothetical protein
VEAVRSHKRELESRMWAKCHPLRGDIPPEKLFMAQLFRTDKDVFSDKVMSLLAMIPQDIRFEIEDEYKDYTVASTTEQVNYALLYRKILEKMEKAGFSWKS